MKLTIRRSDKGFSAYLPKKDLGRADRRDGA